MFIVNIEKAIAVYVIYIFILSAFLKKMLIFRKR